MGVEENQIKLLNADSIEYMKTMRSESIDLICTDVPYKVTSRGNTWNSGGMFRKDLNMAGKVFPKRHLGY